MAGIMDVFRSHAQDERDQQQSARNIGGQLQGYTDQIRGFQDMLGELSGIVGQGYTMNGDRVLNPDGTTARDYSDLRNRANSVADIFGNQNDGFNTFDRFGNERGLAGYNQGLQQSIDTLGQGITDQDRENARSYTAQLLGFNDSAEFQNMVNALSSQVAAGYQGQEGLTAEERDLMNKQIESSTESMYDTRSRELDEVRQTSGSTMAYLANADSTLKSINDYETQARLEMLNADMERKLVQYQMNQDTYWNMVQTGQASMEQYLGGLRSDRLSALQGYAAGIDSITSQYNADITGKAQIAQNVYSAIQVELGIDSAMIDYATGLYEMNVQPLINAANLQLAGLQAFGSMIEMLIAAHEAGINLGGTSDEVAQ